MDRISEEVAQELGGYPAFLAQLLYNRGIKGEIEADKFLNPSYEGDFYDSFLMKDMEKTVDKVFEIVKNNEKVMLYSDYDCDGIPGMIILCDLFEKLNFKNFEVYIPHREEEGYGLNMGALQEIIDKGIKNIITIDLGIADIKEILHAKENGVNVLVMDHHLLSSSLDKDSGQDTENIPEAYTILNSKQAEDQYPYKMLCAAGVVFKFLQAFVKKYGEVFDIKPGWEKWSLDMAGLATLADMVPLVDENRALAHFGLRVLRKNRRVGLQRMLWSLKINPLYLTEDDLYFMIIPRINVASRMTHPREAFETLLNKDESKAGVLVDNLNQINEERKKTVSWMVAEVKQKIEAREIKEVIVVGNPKWKGGVLGLVASKIVEEYKKPAFVWSYEGKFLSSDSENLVNSIGAPGLLIKGSCRSDGTINIFELMSSVRDSFINFGGHEQAGGFSMSKDKIHFLEEELSLAYKKLKKENNSNLDLLVDKKIQIEDVNKENANLIEKMAPFGVANPKPLFLLESLKIKRVKRFGKTKNHLELTFEKSFGETKGIIFFKTEEDFKVPMEPGNRVSILANIEKSFFTNREEIRLRIVDIF